jgi:hypothetical protein
MRLGGAAWVAPPFLEKTKGEKAEGKRIEGEKTTQRFAEKRKRDSSLRGLRSE